MTVDLELTVVREGGDAGYLAAFAITDQLLVAAGGTSNRAPTVLASSNARHFESLATPRQLGLRDLLAVGDALWACGEYGQLAKSTDRGASWKLFETGTEACLFGLALGPDGAVWVVGDGGYAARVLGDRPERVELGTTARLAAVYAVRDEIVMLGFDGQLRRWRDGAVRTVATGATRPLTALGISRTGTWIVIGDGGFVARSPDGAWFSKAHSGVEVDLEAVASLADGRLVAVGDRGQVLVSSDDGRSWKGVASGLTAHLWSIERFGPGAMIGGDDGLIVKLAPPGDATWSDRVNVFGGARPLDALFAAGPEGFIARGLAAFAAGLEAASEAEDDEAGEEVDAEFEDEAAEHEDDEADDDNAAYRALAAEGDAGSFERAYGVALPADVATLREVASGRELFHELELEDHLMPDPAGNLFELLVQRDQHAYLGTGLYEAFCGVFCLGQQGNGDTYHVELYDHDGPRQVLHFDHETAAFTGVFADSLDSLVFLAAAMHAHEVHAISDDAFHVALRGLRGKVAPTWHFSMEDHDPEFTSLDAQRRNTEFFFYRARWICALLRNDGVTAVEDVPRLFMADLNQSVPPDQLPARFEMCERYMPTALYAMWRAFLFDEPELARYLELGRSHAARIVRDAAALIDELRAGRNELGTIRDVRGWLAAFRALDLDPRRAGQRAAEAEQRASVDASRRSEAAAELARTPEASWPELAWRWLGDGAAHRALLAELDRLPPHAAQIAALDQLRELDDAEREAALPRLAAQLSPELEAVLAGSLLRDDQLEGVLQRPGGGEPDAGGGDDDGSPGWEAIDRALAPIYGGREPDAHYGTQIPYALGGPDPIHGISVYLRDEPVPHFHFVTYGFTDLFVKETDDPEDSGFGFELTLRLVRAPGDTEVPMWALNFLQNLGRYVFTSGNRFAAGHKMGLNGPIALGQDTAITAILFADDPELGDIASPFGKARFVQVVGITDDEYRLIQEWSTTGLVDILRESLPMLVTDLARGSVLATPAVAAAVRARVDAEGSSEDMTFGGELSLETDGERVRIELGALYAAALPRAMRGRIRHGRSYVLRGRDTSLQLVPGETASCRLDDTGLELTVPPIVAAEIEARLRPGLAGTFRFETWPGLEIVVTPSFIRDRSGDAIEVKGIADPDEARRMIEEENARVAAERGDQGGDEDDDEADDDDDDDDEDDDAAADDDEADDAEADDDEADAPPRAERVAAALAMIERARRLAPDDEDTQFTHAMLAIDAERSGMPGTLDDILAALPTFGPSVRINVAVRLGKLDHPRFAEAVDLVLGDTLPSRIVADRTTALGGGAAIASYGDVAQELFAELGEAILEHAPDRMTRLAPLLPPDVGLLSALAWKAIQAEQRDHAIVLYDRLLQLPIPEAGQLRGNYLRALNNACIQAHAAKAYEAAVQIADRAQPVAHENPYIYHSAACAYAAVGDYAKAFQQVKLAVEHDYDHLGKVEVDSDLGPLLEWPEFKALFRDWRASKEGN
ncbi:MAG TPA: suppressor of fused domain protein [Kofleriaceae bacterium]|nr:suppressor of fused domain protein [Kofleriaceae bacterium]